jgi:fatty acid amide hydrolase 2
MSPSDDVRRGLEDAADALRARGCVVERWTPPHMKQSFEMWASALSECGGPKFIDVVGDGERVELGKEWLRMLRGKSDHIFPVVALATLEKALSLAPGFRSKNSGLRVAMQSAIEDKLGEDGVLLCPVFHRTAPKHGLPAMASFLGFTYSGVLNPLELPATSVPTGFGADGLPVGVQLAGVRLNDALTLKTAEWIEEALGGWRPPWRNTRRPSARVEAAPRRETASLLS